MATTTNPVDRRLYCPAGDSDALGSTLSNALIITRREVRDSFRDWRILAPIVILTLVFPALAQFVAGNSPTLWPIMARTSSPSARSPSC